MHTAVYKNESRSSGATMAADTKVVMDLCTSVSASIAFAGRKRASNLPFAARVNPPSGPIMDMHSGVTPSSTL
jgi:hypothetical protein